MHTGLQSKNTKREYEKPPSNEVDDDKLVAKYRRVHGDKVVRFHDPPD